MTTYLSLRDLTVRFRTPSGTITAIDRLSLDLNRGEVLGLIGESGSGKSVTLRALLRILPERRTQIDGQMMVGGRDAQALTGADLRAYRGGDVSMIFQEPATALDPVHTIGAQIAEAVMVHSRCSKAAAMSRALEMLDLVRIPSAKARLASYPHEMSGGMRQRAMIALALATRPKLLLADEPTTALDATVQIQVVLLLRDLQRELGMATIFVTHDVGVAAEISDRVAVMYGGRVVEIGTAAQVLKTPAHPYTRGLLSSTVHGVAPGARIDAIPGMPPDPARMPPGCAFAPRCASAVVACNAERPPLVIRADGRATACLRLNHAEGAA